MPPRERVCAQVEQRTRLLADASGGVALLFAVFPRRNAQSAVADERIAAFAKEHAIATRMTVPTRPRGR